MKIFCPPELQTLHESAWLDILLLPPLLWRSENQELRRQLVELHLASFWHCVREEMSPYQ